MCKTTLTMLGLGLTPSPNPNIENIVSLLINVSYTQTNPNNALTSSPFLTLSGLHFIFMVDPYSIKSAPVRSDHGTSVVSGYLNNIKWHRMYPEYVSRIPKYAKPFFTKYAALKYQYYPFFNPCSRLWFRFTLQNCR
jgi:hypothetical protein